jgi:hypothetical protein
MLRSSIRPGLDGPVPHRYADAAISEPKRGHVHCITVVPGKGIVF